MPVGTGNFKNVVAVRQAAESGKQVLALAGVEERDFTQGAAAELSGAPGLRYVASDDEVVEGLEEIWESSSLLPAE